MTSRRLTPEQVYEVGRAAVENALELMSDAMALAAKGRLKRAYARGVIAVEEVAKNLYCREQLRHWTGTLTVHKVKEALRPGGGRAHRARYLTTMQYLWGLAPETPLPTGYQTLEDVVKEDMAARERVLYVDVHDTGQVMDPHGVSDEDAGLWLKAMGKFFAVLANTWRIGLDEDAETARKRAESSADH